MGIGKSEASPENLVIYWKSYFSLILLILALKKKKFDFSPKYKQIWGVVFRKTTLFFFKKLRFHSEKRSEPGKSSHFLEIIFCAYFALILLILALKKKNLTFCQNISRFGVLFLEKQRCFFFK